MTLGRKLWLLIIIKLIIFFAVIKVIFFPDLLKSRYDTDTERADAVRTSLVGTTK
jgi:flagellar basal body-associated protein FliL